MSGFRPIFWGMLFLFGGRIGGWDLLPDAIGYGLIYIGFSRLSKQGGPFASGRQLPLILLVLSIPTLNAAWLPGSWLGVLYPIGLAALQLSMVYSLIKGIRQLAMAQNRLDLYDMARNCWRLYAVGCCLSIAISGLLRISLLLVLVGLFVLLARVLLLVLLSRCGRTFVEREGPPSVGI